MKHVSLFLLRSCGLFVLLLLATQYGAAQPSGCSRPDPGGNPATNGLYAEYYAGYFNDDQTFFTSHPADLLRIDGQLNFPTTDSWGNLVPPAQNTPDDPQQFSARYRGSLYVAVAGNYTFYLTSDDASYLWLDAAAQALPAQSTAALIDNGGGHGTLERSATVFLAAGLHTVLIHYGEDLYGNVLTWEWESADAGIARELVPNSALCTAIQNVLQVPQGITYSPGSVGVAAGAAVSSGVPVVDDGGQAITAFAVANAGVLPAGISIDGSTGVLMAAATVPSGTYSVAVALTNASGTSTFGNAFTFAIAPPPPSGCAGLDPGGAAPARGLYGEYYAGYFGNDHTFFQTNTAGLQRVDALVNFTNTPSWGGIVPPASGSVADPDEFSVRLRGSLYVPVTGSYTLYLTSDDASFLWLGNAALDAPAQTTSAAINNGGLHAARTDSATVFLTAGLHNLLIHYGEDGGGNVLTLEWKSAAAGIVRQLVPAATLCSVVQPLRQPPTALNYVPGSVSAVNGQAVSSAVPAVSSPLPVAGFALLNAASLPAGISLNASTGVLTAAATVPQGRYDVGVVVYNAEGALEQPLAFRFVVTPPTPVGCTGTDPGGRPVAAGLYGEYYAGYFDDTPNNQAYFKLNAPAFARIDPQLNFTDGSWGDVAPPAQGSNADPDRFSARYRGSLYVAVAGNYTFHLTSDDASYLWLDDAALTTPPALAAALIDNGTGHAPRTISNTVYLAAGLHNLLIHYGEYNGGNMLTLEWESPDASLSRQLVPTTVFCSALQAARAPLPVTLVNFRARATIGQIELLWETAQEIDNSHFELERSFNGQTFTTIGQVAGAGTSNSLRNYRYVDTQPLPNISYYRLRQVDIDGTSTVSEPLAVQNGLAGRPAPAAPVATVFPNPNDGRFTVQLTQPATADTRVELLDLRGRVLQNQGLIPGAREQLVEGKGLSKGVYLLRVLTPAGQSTNKVMVR